MSPTSIRFFWTLSWQRHGGSLIYQFGRILKEFGVTTLFRGLFTSCGREGIFCAGYMGLGPVFSEGLRSRFGVEKKVGGPLSHLVSRT